MKRPEKHFDDEYEFYYYDAFEADAYIAHLESRLAQEVTARDHLFGIITAHGEVCPRILEKHGSDK
jgi:hypothetical protein